MTVDKFGIHISKRNVIEESEEREMVYYCILPIIAEYKQEVYKLPNGSIRRCYSVNGDECKMIFPLPEAEITFVHCDPSVSFVLKDTVFTIQDLVGQKLSYGDAIVLIRTNEKPFKVPPVLYVGLVLKCKIESNKNE